ncbi:hypothetical protein [Ruegeria sp. Ofav3-42]|uniref:hypothetical protein n=1 Tax=Ruegeria sp. Ofav3-42 TaxID=2917759 RepID=UPI001EF5B1E6|nr:hypothetical protein [Ruegeria sp. Ofav3-42]MCG7518342.1 hypothetical protein [Ruegeria sp. Ofav3-42]
MNWQQTVNDYGAAWHEPDTGKRLEILSGCFAEDGIYVDPSAMVKGRSNLCGHIAEVVHSTGGKLELTSKANGHNDVIHFTWRLVGADGSVLIAGHDFAHLDAEGKISYLAGFFGDPEPLG